MKFELEPDNRNCPDVVLLDDLRTVARRLGKSSLTRTEYNQHGRFSGGTVETRFGSWNSALESAGLTVQKRVDIPSLELVTDVQRVAGLLGSQTVTQAQYESHGQFSRDTLTKKFGSWPKVLTAAQLQLAKGWKPKATEEELLSNMAVVWECVGRQPRKSDFQPPVSRFTAAPYVRHFHSWRKALEAFVAAANSDEIPNTSGGSDVLKTPIAQPTQYKHKTPRQPGWRLRFLVMRDDRFTCRACGRSPATHTGTILEVDHIQAWDDGGETVRENLQTLCRPCNGGKSNLPMPD